MGTQDFKDRDDQMAAKLKTQKFPSGLPAKPKKSLDQKN